MLPELQEAEERAQVQLHVRRQQLEGQVAKAQTRPRGQRKRGPTTMRQGPFAMTGWFHQAFMYGG